MDHLTAQCCWHSGIALSTPLTHKRSLLWSCAYFSKASQRWEIYCENNSEVWSLICCRIPVPWKMPLSCQRFSSGGSPGKMVLQNPLIFRFWLNHYSNSFDLFTIICVFCWCLCARESSPLLPPKACCERVPHSAGSRGPVDPEGGRHVTQNHLQPARGLDGWMCQTAKVSIADNSRPTCSDTNTTLCINVWSFNNGSSRMCRTCTSCLSSLLRLTFR